MNPSPAAGVGPIPTCELSYRAGESINYGHVKIIIARDRTYTLAMAVKDDLFRKKSPKFFDSFKLPGMPEPKSPRKVP